MAEFQGDTVFKRIKVKLYPTVKQKQMLDDHLNAYRFCYNLCLEYNTTLWNDFKIKKSGYDMGKELRIIRNETEWLRKCKAESIVYSAIAVEKSLKNFYKGKGYPKFKSKNGRQSFPTYNYPSIKENKINFYGSKILYKTSSAYLIYLNNHSINNITFIKESSGDYWATCLIETKKPTPLPENNYTIGIDLGIKDLLITSDGVVYPNNKYLINSEYKLKKLQRKFSKTKKGGKNRDKLRIKVAKVYRKSVRQKEHYYHQITNEIIRENQTIVIETLKIQNMMKNHKVARHISDASWAMLIRQIEYKATWLCLIC